MISFVVFCVEDEVVVFAMSCYPDLLSVGSLIIVSYESHYCSSANLMYVLELW